MKFQRFILLTLIAITAAAILLSGCTESLEDSGSTAQPRVLTIATTTSLYDTGLLDHIRPIFEERYNADVRIISAGTGKALEYGKRGDVDVMMVHDRDREDAFIEEGYGINRKVFAYNYFVIVGPESDPAGIHGMEPEDGFKKIADEAPAGNNVVFISRGDNSGTHSKEKGIWKSAGYDYEDIRNAGTWYVESGRGMGETLVMANEKQAYTLSDIGTFLAFKGDLDLVSHVDSGDVLLNIYSAMQINPERFPAVNSTLAKEWINFLISDEIQNEIGNFGFEQYGQPLFNPSRNASEIIGIPLNDCEDPIA